MKYVNRTLKSIGIKTFSVLSLIACGVMTASADTQFLIEGGNIGSSGLNSSWYSTLNKWNGSTGNITPSGASAVGSRFMGATTSACTLSPVMDTAGGTWLIEFAIPVTSALVAGTKVDIAMTGCSGLPSFTTNFAGGAANTWRTLGTITLDSGVTTPTITFSWDAGNPAPPSGSFFNNRMYVCEFRFTPQGLPCANVPGLGNVNGPLADGQTYVDVPGVTNTATAVTVYSDTAGSPPFTQIGQLTSGIVTNGANRVTTTALAKGSHIVATQTVGGQESCVPGTGPLVGGGANPRIRVNLLLNHDTTLTGPVGSPGKVVADTTLYALGSSGSVNGGFLNAPAQGTVVDPSVAGTCWQTVSFQYGSDLEYPVFGTGTAQGAFATFSGIAFSIDDTTDTGPFAIYIDNISNGTNGVIQDFESPTNGTANYFFSPPRTLANTAVYLDNTPNSVVITTNNADAGSKSAMVSWQFGSLANFAWFPLLASGTNGGPQVDLSQPISVRLLIMPVGQSNSALRITSTSKNTNTLAGNNVTMTVAAQGAGTLNYQWNKDGVDISGATLTTYTITGGQVSDSGLYTATVTDSSTGCTATQSRVVTFADPLITSQPLGRTNGFGQTATFSVTATGTGSFTYQWLKNGTPLNDGGNIAGSSTANLSVSSLTTNDAATYTVTVTGLNSTTSSGAKLTVRDPFISVQPPTSIVATQGVSLNVSATAVGSATLSYQWKKNGSNVSGANSSILTLLSPQGSDSGTYLLSVTNSSGTNVLGTASSSNVVLIVREKLVVTNSSTNVVVTWGSKTATLQTSTNINGPWSNVTATNAITNAVSGGQKYYRLSN